VDLAARQTSDWPGWVRWECSQTKRQAIAWRVLSSVWPGAR
jgi:hypothetical protein